MTDLEPWGYVTDTLPEQCNDCGGSIATDSTPSWVFKNKDICGCCQSHEFTLYYHALAAPPYWHDCEICERCRIYRCEEAT